MKFLVAALIASAAPFVQATLDLNLNAQVSSFVSTYGGVNAQLGNLNLAISAIKAVAHKRGHTNIENKCNEAQGHVSSARRSFSTLSGFSDSPWNARGSSHASEVRYRLSLCGTALSWIAAQPETRRFSDYKTPLSQSQSAYVTGQKGCQQIWDWPSPPTKPAKNDGYGSTPPTNNDGYGSNTPTPTDDGYGPSKPRFEDPTYKPKPPTPSQRYGHRRSLAPVVHACPPFETMCGGECLDLQNEVASCGGCVANHEGENCLLITGADGVGCLDGRCVVLSVHDGYLLGEHGRPVKAY